MQKEKPKVKRGEVEDENAWRSKYLGSIWEAGGSYMTDVERRTAMVKTRFGKMRHMEKQVPTPTAAAVLPTSVRSY